VTAKAATRWQNRIVGEGEEAPDQLLANPRNWRIHSKLQQMSMGAVLDNIGWIQRVLVNRTTGHVLDGHMRIAMAISEGEAAVPVQYVELTEEEEVVALATFDTVGQMAAPDDAMLADLISDAQGAAEGDGNLAAFLGLVAAATGKPAGFKEIGKDIADGVEYIQCPSCGEQFPK
jgi:hypothetical protein